MNTRTDLLNYFIRERGASGMLPDVERLTFADFDAHPEWMGFVE